MVSIVHSLDFRYHSALWKELNFVPKHEVFCFSNWCFLDSTPRHSRSEFYTLPSVWEKGDPCPEAQVREVSDSPRAHKQTSVGWLECKNQSRSSSGGGVGLMPVLGRLRQVWLESAEEIPVNRCKGRLPEAPAFLSEVPKPMQTPAAVAGVGLATFLAVESCFHPQLLFSPTDGGLFVHSVLLWDWKPLIVFELSV